MQSNWRHWMGVAVLAVLALGAPRAWAAWAEDWRSPENLKVIGAVAIEKTVKVTSFSQPAGLFLAGEAAQVQLSFPAADLAQYEGGGIELRGIQTRTIPAGDSGVLRSAMVPPIYAENISPARITLKDIKPALTVELPLPERYGTYALILTDRAGKRTALGSVARLPAPVAGKGTYPQVLAKEIDRLDRAENAVLTAAVQRRLGNKMVRWEVSWGNIENKRGAYDWARCDESFAAFEREGIKLVITTGAHPRWALPFGEPTPAASAAKSDMVCAPEYDPLFGQFIKAFVTRYWRGGAAGMWGIEHWNEPWQGTSISGWSSSVSRYRQLLEVLSTQAKAAAPQIKILAAGSVMNTEDNLLSDGSDKYIRMLDIMSDHYVKPRNSWGPMVAEKFGKVTGETETWGAATEGMFVQFMTQFLASGRMFLSPSTGDMLLYNLGPAKDRMFAPHPLVTAVGAWNALIADRPFQRVAFVDHLPWLYQFGPDEDAVFVLYGRHVPIQSGIATDVVWPQASAGPDGEITLAHGAADIEVFDAAGNRVAPTANGQYRLALNATAYYLRGLQRGAQVVEAVRQGTVTGLRPVEILPQALGKLPAAGHPVTLPVAVHSLHNAPLRGQLKVSSLRADAPLEFTAPLAIAAGRTQTVEVTLAQFPAGGWPLRFSVTCADGAEATWQEVIQPTVVAFAADGKVDWARVPAVTVLRPAGKKTVDDMTQLWLPYLKADPQMAPARRGEVRLAWDKQQLYIRAVVTAETLTPRLRMATRDDSSYFHRADSPQVEERYAVFAQEKKIDFARASTVYRRRPVDDLPWSGDVFQFAFDMDPAAQRMLRTHDLSYPVDRVPAGLFAVPDTDHEFSLYLCADGKPELWRLLSPTMPRYHNFPMQPQPEERQRPVAVGRMEVRHAEGQNVFEAAIPWSELGVNDPQPGMDFGFTFRFGFVKGGDVEFGLDKAVNKGNALTLHPYWGGGEAWAGVRWTLQP